MEIKRARERRRFYAIMFDVREPPWMGATEAPGDIV